MNRLFSTSLLFCSFSVYADHVPGHAKLELGFGVLALSMPDYRGSSNSQTGLVPFPYIKYRGERLTIDDGIQARLLKTPDLILSISGNGSLPSSGENSEREGMPSLDATAEFGPSAEYRLRQTDTTSIWLEIPLRLAASIGENTAFIGKVFNPKLSWRKPAQNKFDWKFGLSAGLLYADEDFHRYYYSVSNDQVRPERPWYTAKAGYSGSRSEFTVSRRIDKLWLGGFIRYDSINGSVIEDSPLVSVSSNWTAGLALAWVFADR